MMVDIRLNSLPCCRTPDACQQANRLTRISAITQTPAFFSSSSTYHLKVDFSERAYLLTYLLTYSMVQSPS